MYVFRICPGATWCKLHRCENVPVEYFNSFLANWPSGNSKVALLVPVPIPDFSRDDGLLPAIAQDASTGEAVYFSRSRGRLWRKGEESGNVQKVQSVFVDCDGDTILLKVDQVGGAACHEGYKSCFFRQKTQDGWRVIAKKVFIRNTFTKRSKGTHHECRQTYRRTRA